MRTETIIALAASFWERVGMAPSWPRDLETVIARVVPVWVVARPRLTPGVARDWLRRRGLELPLDLPERPLDGCILAFRGNAVIFVDEALPADQRLWPPGMRLPSAIALAHSRHGCFAMASWRSGSKSVASCLRFSMVNDDVTPTCCNVPSSSYRPNNNDPTASS